jgi:cell wall-associated NlpC family hydrolase
VLETYSGRHRLPIAGTGLPTMSRTGRAVGLALGACLCAGQLLTGSPAQAAPPPPATTALAVAAQAAPAVRVAPTFTKRTIRYGQSVLVSGRALDGQSGKPLGNRRATVQYTIGKGWKTAKTMRTSAAGNAWLTARPPRETVYRVLVSGASTPAIRVHVTGIPKVTKGQRAVAEAAKMVGRPYRYAAAGPRAFDCSGLTQFVYRKVGKKLPHKANSQQRYGRAVSHANARPGDLIVFRRGSYGYHVAIYAGHGYMYDAPKPGTRVGKRKIWSNNYVVRRLV